MVIALNALGGVEEADCCGPRAWCFIQVEALLARLGGEDQPRTLERKTLFIVRVTASTPITVALAAVIISTPASWQSALVVSFHLILLFSVFDGDRPF